MTGLIRKSTFESCCLIRVDVFVLFVHISAADCWMNPTGVIYLNLSLLHQLSQFIYLNCTVFHLLQRSENLLFHASTHFVSLSQRQPGCVHALSCDTQCDCVSYSHKWAHLVVGMNTMSDTMSTFAAIVAAGEKEKCKHHFKLLTLRVSLQRKC